MDGKEKDNCRSFTSWQKKRRNKEVPACSMSPEIIDCGEGERPSETSFSKGMRISANIASADSDQSGTGPPFSCVSAVTSQCLGAQVTIDPAQPF